MQFANHLQLQAHAMMSEAILWSPGFTCKNMLLSNIYRTHTNARTAHHA